ncbi:MAG: hypothetical protein PHT16_00330 [Candidatus Pacebacteria bacterium]|nr:hypothetical protein [Candidatus Paceibacterota bacterium]
MNTKKITFGLLLLSLFGLGIGFFLLKFYECGYSIFCYNLINTSKALFYGMSALALVFFILIFAQQAFSAWKKFAIWFIPLATLLFIFYPNPSSGDYFSPYPEQIFKWVSIMYVVISILIIALKQSDKETRRLT